MTAALKGGEWSAARPGRTLRPGKTRYPFYRRLGGPQGRSGQAENLVPTGIRSRTVQPAVNRYTDWATRPTPSKVVFYISLHSVTLENFWVQLKQIIRLILGNPWDYPYDAVLLLFWYTSYIQRHLELSYKQKCVCIPWTTLLQL